MSTMTSRDESIVQAAENVIGTRFVIENTGGGNECHVARLEGGAVLVMSDGLANHTYSEHGFVVFGLYPSEEAWTDSGDYVGYGDTTDLSDAGVQAALLRAMGGAL